MGADADTNAMEETTDSSEHNTSTTTPKPILLLICPRGQTFWSRFRRILLKLQRDAQLVHAADLPTLDTHLATHTDEPPTIAGILITDASIMNSSEPCTSLSTRLATLAHTYPVIFAFDFPTQAARRPLLFARYMRTTFGLAWQMAGCTTDRVELRLRPGVLWMARGRECWRYWYEMRAVVLRGVEREDKVLVVTGVGVGGQPEDKGILGGERGDATSTTDDGDDYDDEEEQEENEDEDGDGDEDYGFEGSNASSLESESTGSQPGDEAAHEEDWADDEMSHDEDLMTTMSTADDILSTSTNYSYVLSDDGTSRVPSYIEHTVSEAQVADSAVVFHEVADPAAQETATARGYVGFVGHVEDNRSMSSIILGMCSIPPFAA
ncbi:hypothetical protein ASPWEDRAFT_167017 [Aspergillus terreus]|uniref:Uncharacterized protein n=1 Tax=Aspergillus terreus TaxID=33178 RepID=A0A5M3Z4Y5_ASPTE|nr:hypothetical protein ATETN484_0007040600 [Aspergillus terreus]GFF16211.1 hypothetical protein ASPWEDRAFT_167017 [Aspergillus terreus]